MTTNDSIRVLVADDSAFMRNALGRMISEEPGMQVAGKARNGAAAVEMVRELEPDLVTLDIEMPEMDGLTALRLIRQFSQVPVLMVSSLTTDGSLNSLRAMRYGAGDVVAKDHSMVSTNINSLRDELISKIRALTETNQASARPIAASGSKPVSSCAASTSLAKLPDLDAFDLLVIGSSTGAPPQLELLTKAMPADLPVPVLIAQHMPPVFTASLATRLDSIGKLKGVEARHGMALETGTIAVAPGGQHTRVAQQHGSLVIRISDKPAHLIYKPSVDELFASAAEATGAKTLGIVLTGMGADGANGAKDIHRAGGKIITQSADSCVVYGMPKAVDDAGVSHAKMSPEQIASYLSRGGASNQRLAG